MRTIKDAALRAIAHPMASRALARLRRSRVNIVMLHRFRAPHGKQTGHTPERLRDTLSHLRAIGARFVQLDDLLLELDEGAPLTGSSGEMTVAFTVDDGYADLLQVGLPIFREFDCPVTAFVVPHMVDGSAWFWWDQLEYVMKHTEHPSLQVELPRTSLSLSLTDPVVRKQSLDAIVDQLKRVTNAERLSVIAQVIERSGVELSATTPREYRVLTWDELRAAEAPGVIRFGAHSLSHPILSQCGEAEAREEVAGSIARVRAELRFASGVFCYPNGRYRDLGAREESVVRESDAIGGLSSEPGYIDRREWTERESTLRWRLPRFSFDDRPPNMARDLLL